MRTKHRDIWSFVWSFPSFLGSSRVYFETKIELLGEGSHVRPSHPLYQYCLVFELLPAGKCCVQQKCLWGWSTRTEHLLNVLPGICSCQLDCLQSYSLLLQHTPPPSSLPMRRVTLEILQRCLRVMITSKNCLRLGKGHQFLAIQLIILKNVEGI